MVACTGAEACSIPTAWWVNADKPSEMIIPVLSERCFAVFAFIIIFICFDDAIVGIEVEQADRKSVVSGTSVSVRVDLGGRRLIKKKILTTSIAVDFICSPLSRCSMLPFLLNSI